MLSFVANSHPTVYFEFFTLVRCGYFPKQAISSANATPLPQVSADKAQAYDTVVFAGPPPMKQRLWPRHCVQDTWGAELHKDLKVT